MILRCIFCTLASAVLYSFLISVVHGQAPGSSDLPSALESPSTISPTPAPAEPRKKIVYREKSYYDFEDTLINGNVRKPDGSFIYRKSQNTFSSALNLRRSFIPELKESSHDAR